MTNNSGKRDRKPVLVAALSLLGASLGIAAPQAHAADNGATGIWVKDQATSKQHKGEPTSNQYKEHSAEFLKLNADGSNQIKLQSNQYKEHPDSNQMKFWSPSSNQLKLDSTKSNQLKLDSTHSNQVKLKGGTSNQIKLDTPGGGSQQQ